MTITAQMHDGRVLEFPDGTSTQVIQNVVRQQIKASTPAKPAPKETVLGRAAGAMANFNRGLGIGDELAAGTVTVKDLDLGRELASKVTDNAEWRAERPGD